MSSSSGPGLEAAYPATLGVTESGLHAVVRYLSYGALRAHFAGRPGCFVGQDRNVYCRRGDSRTFVAPDVFACFGVDPDPLEFDRSYRPWDAGGPPAWVLEVASERTFRADLEDKPATYLEVGVQEYWRLDPTGGEFFSPFLQGDRRAGGAWEPIEVTPHDDGRLSGHSAALGLELHAEARRLRFRDPRRGRWLPDPDESEHRRAAEAAARRDAETARLAAEDRAQAAEAARRDEAAARRAAESERDAAEAELAALRARLSDQAT